jgi:hypothetical protein
VKVSPWRLKVVKGVAKVSNFIRSIKQTQDEKTFTRISLPESPSTFIELDRCITCESAIHDLHKYERTMPKFWFDRDLFDTGERDKL